MEYQNSAITTPPTPALFWQRPSWKLPILSASPLAIPPSPSEGNALLVLGVRLDKYCGKVPQEKSADFVNSQDQSVGENSFLAKINLNNFLHLVIVFLLCCAAKAKKRESGRNQSHNSIGGIFAEKRKVEKRTRKK